MKINLVKHQMMKKLVTIRGGGEEGIVFDAGGNQVKTFEWSLGRPSNNQAKALALFHGLRLLDASYNKSLIAIGDSTLVIKLTLKTSSPSDGKLA